MLAFKYGSLQLILDENFLSDLMLYVMKCSIKLFMWWDVNFLLIYLGLGWNDHVVYMGYVNGAQIGSCACCHVVVHVSIHVVSCHHHFPCHCHVKLHVIIAIHVISMSAATSSPMSSMCDMTIESVTKITICDVYFRHRKWAWVGLRGPGDILWRFRNVMDQAIYDENLRNVTRCDLWRSIHDVIWDRHRYCFMMVF